MNKVFEHISILCVEDDELTLLALSKMLKKRVSTLYPASSGAQALAIYEKEKPDIVITDISMPGMSGLELTREIKKRSPDTPVVIITSYTDSQNLQDALNIGADKLLCKPIQKEELFDVLNYFNQLVFNAKQVRRQQYQLSQLDTIIDHTLMVARLDKNGNYTYVNERFEQKLGLQENQLLGKYFDITFAPQSAKESQDIWKKVTQNHLIEKSIVHITDKGIEVQTEATIMSLHDQQNRVYGYYAIFHDVSGALHANELLHQQELAKTKDSFLVIFTHELKTPLNAIMNFTKYVSKRLHKSEQKEALRLGGILDDVYTNACDMLEHIQSILDIAKLQHENLQLNLHTFDLVSLINDITKPLDQLLVQDNITLTSDLPTRHILHSDQLTLKRIISNIYSNAIKYGHDKIDITLKSFDEGFELTISDNGSGISDKEKIFELFEQLQGDDIKRNAKGTGIGLYFVKIAASALDITIDVKDNLPKGSQFILRKK
jgi:PAS domain S-box-containing protein